MLGLGYILLPEGEASNVLGVYTAADHSQKGTGPGGDCPENAP